MTTKLSFSQRFLPESCATQMLIPLSFVRCTGGSLPEKIFLRDRYQNLWRVNAGQVGENWYFKNGWAKFIKDNKILPLQVLVFDYFEEDLFDFKILGKNGRENKGAGVLMVLDIDETDEENDDSEEVDRELKQQEDLSEKSEEDDDYYDYDDDDDTEDADYLPNQEIEVEQVKNGKYDDSEEVDGELKKQEDLSEKSEEDDDDYEYDDDDDKEDADYLPNQENKVEQVKNGTYDDSEEVDRELKKEEDLPEKSEEDYNDYDYDDDDDKENADYLPNQEIEVDQVKNGKYDDTEEVDHELKKQLEDLSEKSEDDDEDKDDYDDHEKEEYDYLPNQGIKVELENKVGRRKRRNYTPPLYPKFYGFEIFESGLAKQPQNPYFVITVKAKRKADLFIPLPLIEEYGLDLPKPVMIIVDPQGRLYRGKYRRWSDGRIMYSGDWRRLILRNNLVVGDTCICEFVEVANGLYLKTSFLRTSTGRN